MYELPIAGLRRLAREGPGRPAILSAATELTRRDFDRYSNGYARAFAQDGTDRSVAFLIDDPLDLIAAVFGAFKAGRVFTILGASDPEARIRDVVKDAGASAIVATERTLDRAQSISSELRVIRAAEVEAIDDFVPVSVHRDTPAYLTYTSGSTGAPKGVIRTHGTEAAMAHGVRSKIGIGPEDRLLPLFAPAFAASVTWNIMSLLAGATLCLYSLESLNLSHLARWLKRERVTGIETTPSLFRALQAAYAAGETIPSIRSLVFGGEPVTEKDIRAFRALFPSLSAANVIFGSSEGGVLFIHRIDSTSLVDGGGVPLGEPLPDATVRLVDDALEDVPRGETGELLVESPQVSPGYWGAPERTVEKFLPGTRPGTRILRTGDQARVLSDGRIVFLGRRDTMLNIRGFRVDSAEVESMLMALPHVREAVVVGKPGAGGYQHLVAYLVDDGSMTVPALRAALADRLPVHSVPSLFVRLPALPRNANGKADRKSLEARDDLRPGETIR